jgi:RNA polymerase sigma-70 factor (ECF subfamily)
VEFFEFDQAYLDRLRARDSGTVDHFVAYFGQLLRAVLRTRRLSPDRVDDLTQETFRRILLILQRPDALRDPRRFGAFVISTCKNALRESDRIGRHTETSDDGILDIPAKLPDIVSEIQAKQDREQVRRILAGMSAKDRGILRDIFFLEKNKDQICRERGVDREYLRVLVHRAKARFRADFEGPASQKA